MKKPYPENILSDIFAVDFISENESYDEILAFVKSDMKNTIDLAIDSLRETFRERVCARYKDGKTYREISEIYNISQGRASETIQYALCDLRRPKRFNLIKYGLSFKNREITLDDKLQCVLSDQWKYTIFDLKLYYGVETIRELINYGIKNLHHDFHFGKIKYQRFLQELKDLNIEELTHEADKYLTCEIYPINLLAEAFDLEFANNVIKEVPDIESTIRYLFSLKLDTEHKTIIQYHYKQRHSFERIQRMMDCKQSSIDTAIKLGLSELRKNKELISKGITKCLSDIIK